MDIHDKIIDLRFPKCPIRNVIARIGDRWSILLLLTLDSAEGPMRFKKLQQAAPDISQKMLTRTLRDLEADGYVTRKAYAEVPFLHDGSRPAGGLHSQQGSADG